MEIKQLTDYLGGRFLQVPISMMQAFGVMEAVFVVYLFEHRRYMIDKGLVEKDDFFFLLQEDVYRQTGIAPSTQTTYIRSLMSMGILLKEKLGLPAKNYYFINSVKLIEAVHKYSVNHKNKFDGSIELDSVNPSPIYNNNRNNKEEITYSFPKEGKESVPNSGTHISVFKTEDLLQEYEADAIALFKFWNMLGDPVPVHKENTKLYIKAIKLMAAELRRGYSADEIGEAMGLYLEMLSQPDEWQLNAHYALHRVGIDEFFCIESIQRKQLDKKNIAKHINSWFEECMKGRAYLLSKYVKLSDNPRHNRMSENTAPRLTKELKRLWDASVENGDGYKFAPRKPADEDAFIKSASRFESIKKKLEDDDLVSFINIGGASSEAKSVLSAIKLDVEGRDIEVTPQWLCSDKMFYERLPKYWEHQEAINRNKPWRYIADKIKNTQTRQLD